MRYICLNSSAYEPLLNLTRARMREENFLSSIRAFLSLLAIAEVEDLDYVQSKLLPHRLSIDRGPPPPLHKIAPPIQSIPSHHAKGNSQQSHNHLTIGNGQSLSTCSAPPRTTSDTDDPYDLFARYTTLGYRSSPNEGAASVDIEMSTATSEDANHTRAASDPINPVNNDMSDKAGDFSSQVMRHTYYSSESPFQASSSWSTSPILDNICAWSGASPSPSPNRCLRDFKRLESLYRGGSARGLNNIPAIISLGDRFLREEVVDFVKTLHQTWRKEGLWNRTPLNNPSTGSSVVERMFNSLRCAETIEHDSAVNPIRLRMARIFLYHYFEQKCIDMRKDPNLNNLLSQGKRVSSVVLDVILEEMHNRHNQQVVSRVSKQRRKSLKDHKVLGKRWSILAYHLGIGIIITCSRSLETHMNNTKFTEKMILALLTYTLNVYPQGVQVSQMLDPFVQCMMGGASSSAWPAAEKLAAINEYKQKTERACNPEKNEWQPVAPPEKYVLPMLMQEVSAQMPEENLDSDFGYSAPHAEEPVDAAATDSNPVNSMAGNFQANKFG